MTWLAAAGLAPLPHGTAGAWDELALMVVAFALFGGYILWLRGVIGGRTRDDGDRHERDDGDPPGREP